MFIVTEYAALMNTSKDFWDTVVNVRDYGIKGTLGSTHGRKLKLSKI